MVDSGSEVTVLDSRMAEKMNIGTLQQCQVKLQGANGLPIRVLGYANLGIVLGPSLRFQHSVLVADGVTSGFILGSDVLEQHKLVLDAANKRLCRGRKDLEVTLASSITIPRFSERSVCLQTAFVNKEILFVPSDAYPGIAPGLAKTDEKGRATFVWANATDWPMAINRNEKLGKANFYDPSKCVPDVAWKNIAQIRRSGKQSNLANEELVKQVSLSHLPDVLKQKYRNAFLKYPDVFSLNPNDIGHCKVLPQRIILKDAQKISCTPPYRTPQNLQPVVENYVQTLLEAGIIRKSTSPFCSPLLLVKKANSSPDQPLVQQFRVVHDYRALNSNTIRDSYPLHNLYDLIDKVAASKVWSVIDLSSGFWNQALSEESMQYTAFAVPGKGHYEYTRSAQGLCNSPAAFQRLLDFVVRDIPNVFVYIDDLVIASQNHDEHVKTMTQVLERFRKYNLKCRPHKLQVATAEINYLGYNLSHSQGIRPGEIKTKAVANWKEPSSVKEIRQFLGLCSFFRRTIPHFASIASPLTKLTRKDSAWVGGPLPEEARKGFLELKRRLTARPSLTPPDFSLPFILTVDASKEGLGAVLSQKKKNQVEYPVAYASRVLNDAEKKNASFHLEYLAMSWACKHFRPYLVGKRFTLRSDHKPLQTLNKTKGAAFERCLLELSDFDFEVEYLKGSQMPADGLSRQGVNEMSMTNVQNYINFSWSQVRDMQKQDPEIKALAVALLYGKVAGSDRLASFINNELKYSQIKDGVVIRSNGSNQVYAPRAIIQNLLNIAHDCPAAGHYGPEKTYQRLKGMWYWPSMINDIKLHCRGCLTCQQTSTAAIPPLPLGRLPPAGDINDRVHMDLLGPLPDNLGMKYVMIVVDAYSKFLQLIPLENKTMEETSQALLDHWITIFGIPKVIVSDQGNEFTNSLMTTISRFCGFKLKTTSPYHPMGNGQAEASVKEVLRYARKFVAGNDWLGVLPNVRFAHNTVFNVTIKCTPYEAMFKKLPLLPGQVIQPKVVPNYKADIVSQKLHHLLTLRNEVMREAESSYLSWKAHFDKRAKERKFEPGDKIFLRKPVERGQYHKFQDKFFGPFIVTKVFPTGNLEIIHYDPRVSKKTRLVHGNNVRLAEAALQIYDTHETGYCEQNERPARPLRQTKPIVQTGFEEEDENELDLDTDFVTSSPMPRVHAHRPDSFSHSSSSPSSSPHQSSSPMLSRSGSTDDTFHSPSEGEQEMGSSSADDVQATPERPTHRQTRSTRQTPLSPGILSRYLPLKRGRRPND